MGDVRKSKFKPIKIREKEKSYLKKRLESLSSKDFLGSPFNEVRDTFTQRSLLKRVTTIFESHKYWKGIRPETLHGRDQKTREMEIAIKSLISGLKTINKTKV